MDDLRDLIALHQLALNAEGRSIKTQKQYLFFHSIFLDFLSFKGIPPTLAALNVNVLRSATVWYQAKVDRRRSRGGEVAVRALVDLVKRLGTFAEEEGILENSPLRKMKRVRITKYSREPFTLKEVSAMWGAATRTDHPERDLALFLLLLDTGMRIGEACGLKISDLHVDGEERYVLVGAIGKSRNQRRVPIGDSTKRDGGRTLRALRGWLAARPDSRRGGDALFIARDGYPFTASGGNSLLHRVGDSVGVPNAHPHRLKHTFCTWYLTEYPGDEIGLRRIVGNVSRDVMMNYVHIAQSVLAERQGQGSLVERLNSPLSAVKRHAV